MEILIFVCLVIGAALLCGNGPAEPPIYQIQLVPPEQPRGRGHLIAAVVLMLLIVLMLASG
jgi:hypothetical protein